MQVRSRQVVLTAVAASSLLLLTACNSDSGGGTEKKPSAAPSAPAHITAAQADQALVSLEDLPAGWKVEANTTLDKSQGAEEEAITDAKPECAPITGVLNSGQVDQDHKAKSERVFTKKGDQTMVAQVVNGYTLPQAEKTMAGLRTAVETTCATFTGKQGGKKTKVTVKKTAEQHKYGDESLTYTVKVVTGDQQMDFDMGTVRSRGAITTVINNYPDKGDRGKEAFSKALAKASEKLTAATAKTT
ncbi:hypothetical protein [Streptomyces triculaminicus]|uniref:hypothetical protein n=1 Tax=Streptomyces triculaminicus TaxID=2816232 RepID=UPI0037CDD8D0